jgi:glycyl-tRNA synthetase
VLTMQDALLRLTEYWASHGCMIVQPMNTEVGAGTLNPATALRVLGPEPWRVAYVEPSVRPDDSRYGDNPNRLQTHTQFQVILKPDPGDPQELFLGSLEALGVDLRRHDVRFVEDNWASPALGAWGLGWEVWLDGLEITQFTYFQQAGGISLDPVSVEITYGMERIVMALQQVSHFKDIAYAPGISYGEAFGQAEYEMSRYYLDDADLGVNQTLFEAYAAEAERLIAIRLPVPAHTYVLKCSHTFNVLDARGAISTTERARAFARMRTLSHQVAELWLERRAELGHPLGLATSAAPVPVRPGRYPELAAPAPLAFEIGVEEMPPAEVARGAESVRAMLTERLAASRLGHGRVRVVASPRRIVATVDQVEPREADHQRTVRGPRVSAAFDADGAPTKAALGFARGQGVDVAGLRRMDVDGVEYVGVVQQCVGRPAAEVLGGVLAEVVSGLRADTNMRWGAPGMAFIRPIRWILAVLGDEVVPFGVSTLVSGRTTRVHRAAVQPAIEVRCAAAYLDTLRRHGILADPSERREAILEGAVELAASVDGRIDRTGESGLIDEVTNLVEGPTPILGRFDDRYLSLPAPVLTTVMRRHQRYLPVRGGDDRLLPFFVAVANGDCDPEVVRAGNEAVLRARYEDATFFWDHDLATPPAGMKARLAKLTFETRLGSMADRADRISALAAALATRVQLTDEELATLSRAGHLTKFDLGSQMVVELPSLAGVMAREYALRAGEPEPVARALYEEELPRQARDSLPVGLPGALLALADRFDLIAGLFAIGSVPTGSSDPFGLRRAALGVIGILLAHPRLAPISLREGLRLAGRQQPVPLPENAGEEAHQFILRRFEQHQLDAGLPVEVVRAVLPLADRPATAARTATDLTRLLGEPEFREVAQAIQRVRRIVPAGTPAGYDRGLFESTAEEELEAAVTAAAGRLRSPATLPEFTTAAAALVEPIERFFDDVLVMAEDPAVRSNRLGLLATLGDLATDVLDWAALG